MSECGSCGIELEDPYEICDLCLLMAQGLDSKDIIGRFEQLMQENEELKKKLRVLEHEVIGLQSAMSREMNYSAIKDAEVEELKELVDLLKGIQNQ